MSFKANNTAGVIGKFGQSTFTSVSRIGSNNPPQKQSKFFKSRDITLTASETIEEEDEEQVDETETVKEQELTSVQHETPSNKVSTTDTIKVGVRVRPIGEDDDNVIDVNDTQIVVAAEKIFNFDLVFGIDTLQETLYNNLIHEQIQNFLSGFNATVFAYGQTGTGKTFSIGTNNNESMLESDNRGVIIRALQQVFSSIEQESSMSSVVISFLEIAKEQVFDLLNSSKSREQLQVREFKPGVFRVTNLTEKEVGSLSEAVGILTQGSKLRSTEATASNSASSRSHAVFSISIISSSNGEDFVTRKLNIVDLAGSESQGKTGAVGMRFEEAKSINKGLTVLNRVISSLSKKNAHIPYRDSVLTKVLKDSLESHCYISMLACISPSVKDIAETISTLRFTNDAKQLKTKPLPASFLESCKSSAVKCIPKSVLSTPMHKGNNTVHGVTPRSAGFSDRVRPRLNHTIATPGKRQRMDLSYQASSSTVAKSRFINESLCDISAVGISMIEPPAPLDSTASSFSTINSNVTTNPNDMSVLLSPLMRTIREKMQEEFRQLKSELMNSKVKKSPRQTKTPLKMAKSRATSSPNRNMMTLHDDDKDEDIDCEAENFISGVGVSFQNKPRSINPRLLEVIESASPKLSPKDPVLFEYDSPPSSSRVNKNNPVSASPTIEEMERTLGINPDSPSLMFSLGNSDQTGTVKKSVRSSRRTTMMASELNETLREIQNVAISTNRRSIRVASKRNFNGSPLERENDGTGNSNNEDSFLKHPLLEEDKKMNSEKQKKHNGTILDFINIGTVKLLGGLPAVGPKTAFLIYQHRQLHGEFTSLSQLETIPGIGKNFFKKFCKQNQIDGLEA